MADQINEQENEPITPEQLINEIETDYKGKVIPNTEPPKVYSFYESNGQHYSGLSLEQFKKIVSEL